MNRYFEDRRDVALGAQPEVDGLAVSINLPGVQTDSSASRIDDLALAMPAVEQLVHALHRLDQGTALRSESSAACQMVRFAPEPVCRFGARKLQPFPCRELVPSGRSQWAPGVRYRTEQRGGDGYGRILSDIDRNLMKNEPTEPRKSGRIEGTLHKPGYARPAPRQDADLPREKAEEGEVAGRHKNTGQKDHKGAR